MIYIASPYSDESPTTVNINFETVERFVASEFKRRLAARSYTETSQIDLGLYSSIVHCHEMAIKYNLPTDASFWWEYNKAMMIASHEMIVLTFGNWEKSIGVQREIAYMQGIGLPTTFVNP